jgi:ribosomal protein L3
MTQVFIPEDGHVERVTVIEAGPCFVTAIRRADRDGYDAVQLAFGDATEKSLNKPRLGHSATSSTCASSAATRPSSRSATRSRSTPCSRRASG